MTNEKKCCEKCVYYHTDAVARKTFMAWCPCHLSPPQTQGWEERLNALPYSQAVVNPENYGDPMVSREAVRNLIHQVAQEERAKGKEEAVEFIRKNVRWHHVTKADTEFVISSVSLLEVSEQALQTPSKDTV